MLVQGPDGTLDWVLAHCGEDAMACGEAAYRQCGGPYQVTSQVIVSVPNPFASKSTVVLAHCLHRGRER